MSACTKNKDARSTRLDLSMTHSILRKNMPDMNAHRSLPHTGLLLPSLLLKPAGVKCLDGFVPFSTRLARVCGSSSNILACLLLCSGNLHKHCYTTQQPSRYFEHTYCKGRCFVEGSQRVFEDC